MKRFFIHHPAFRALSPVFSGTLVYLLLLLINNNISQVQESFFGQELYVCIGLAYLIQEFARFSILFFAKLQRPKSFFVKTLTQVVVTIMGTMLLVSFNMYFYFKYMLLYTPNFRELLVFNIIFSFIGLVYIVLFFSHHFLYKINTQKIAEEQEAKAHLEEDIKQYKKGINPELLFESLEMLLVTMKKNPEKAETLTDNFALVYRYILSQKNNELVQLKDELSVLRQLLKLYRQLPYRKLKLILDLQEESWIPPTILLTLVESILRSTIPTNGNPLDLNIITKGEKMSICYVHEERLKYPFSTDTLKETIKKYSYFSNKEIGMIKEGPVQKISLPILTYDESSHN